MDAAGSNKRTVPCFARLPVVASMSLDFASGTAFLSSFILSGHRGRERWGKPRRSYGVVSRLGQDTFCLERCIILHV